MNFFERVNKYFDLLSDSEKFLLRYIQEHINEMPQISIVRLSEKANVSTATIVRTMKKLGYDGFTSFKIRLKDEHRRTPEFSVVEKVDNKIKEAILKNEREVTKTIQMLDRGTIEDVLQKIIYARKIFLFARGFSELIAKEMCIKFQLVNKYCEMHDDPNIIRTISSRIEKQDLVIFISLNGSTAELVEAAKNCKANGISTVTLTANRDSPLYALSELALVGYKSKESYFPDYEVRSRLPLQIMGRIILDAYAIRTRA
ncbi:MurR/RpiR family transcriptional regulator [Sporolactobacillus sp. CPB3-1]|uniref:MurR/RpiR family transcriptional regulator n=1 Tax=Sporolactobacillus mangiferae TaxID=2940498 RepID=A0ABT0M9C3_9BACL|nr:MurR/RpiR family transcriptional regulator [Sporolactobacillus mangiferae]MCL1631472.1 MurR/RpiR family transcriptional regulator [Sporolactobacillus mangiferae]